MNGYIFEKPNVYNKNFIKKGFVYLNNNSVKKEIKIIRNIIKKIYYKPHDYYTKLNYDEYYSLNIKALEAINKKIKISEFQKKCIKYFCQKLNLKKSFKRSSFISLLNTRPAKNKAKLDEAEFVGLHRENFYGNPKYVNYQINFWFPIFNINKLQNFKFVEGSHDIPDKNIKFKKVISPYIKKNSKAHTCGLNYAPKKIISGVPFSKTKRFQVPKDCFLIFNSNLIHGGGKNLTKKMRFALSFGIVGKKHFKNISIPQNFRSGKPHYVN